MKRFILGVILISLLAFASNAVADSYGGSYGGGGGGSTSINDSAGNGDTTVTYSADKIFDLLALKQALDAELTALAGLTSAANAIPYFTGSGTAGVISSSADMVALLGSDSYATARTNMGLAIGTDVQAYDANTMKDDGAVTTGHLVKKTAGGTYESAGAPIEATDGIKFTVDGGGSAFTTGLKTCTVAAFAMDITGWTLINTPAATITIDVWKDTTAAWIAGTLTNADTITNAHEPATANTLGATDADLSDWTTAKLAVAVGDVICFNVDANDSAVWAQLVLTGTRK